MDWLEALEAGKRLLARKYKRPKESMRNYITLTRPIKYLAAAAQETSIDDFNRWEESEKKNNRWIIAVDVWGWLEKR